MNSAPAGAGLLKKKKKAQNAQTCQNVDVNMDPNPHLWPVWMEGGRRRSGEE